MTEGNAVYTLMDELSALGELPVYLSKFKAFHTVD